MRDSIHNNSLSEEIEHRLSQFDRIENNYNLTQAAVVIGISALGNSTSACILLTRRSSKLRKHSGQYALPGGKVDRGETVVEAALRELQEELGLIQSSDSVLGLLDDMPTQSGFNITPVVVWIDSLDKLKPNPDEVADVFQIPLAELKSLNLNLSQEDPGQDRASAAARKNTDINNADLKETARKETAIKETAREDAEKQTAASENDVMSLYLPSVGTTVYSPTAAIIYQFREVAMLGKPTRVAHFGQPRFAWQ